MYEYPDGTKIKTGDEVHIAEGRPEGFAQSERFQIVAVQDEEKNPGKVIGVAAPTPSPFLHDCDGAAPAQCGWWTRPEHIIKAAD